MSDDKVPPVKYWRYQPVFVEEGGENSFSVCECYFDKDHQLIMWTTKPAISPYGNTAEEFVEDLEKMARVVRKYKAVPFESLKPGMIFELNKAEDVRDS